MAKSARASVRKQNRTNLRHRVFAPADQARTERLSAKLVDLASQPKPDKLEDMDIEAPKKPESLPNEAQNDAMEVDGDAVSKAKTKKSGSKRAPRVQKKRRGKATSTIVFPALRKGKLRSAGRKHKK